MRVILFLTGLVGWQVLSAQNLILYPFQPAANSNTISYAKFKQLAITYRIYYIKATQNALPELYYASNDTLKPSKPIAIVAAPKGKKTCEMMAYLKKDSVRLIEIGESSEGKSV